MPSVDDRRVAAERRASLEATVVETRLDSWGAEGAAIVTAVGGVLGSEVDEGDKPELPGAAVAALAARPQVLQ
jgi:hypothetical protein